MRLLLLLTSLGRGGAEEYALVIGAGGVAQGWKVNAAFSQCEGTASLIEDLSRQEINYHPTDIGERFGGHHRTVRGFLRRMWHTMFLLISVKPDIVLINLQWISFGLAPMLACRLLGIPTASVFHLMNGAYRCSRSKNFLYKWLLTRGHRWIAISNYNRNMLVESFSVSPESITVIQNGVNLSGFCYPDNDKSVIRKKLLGELNLDNDVRLLLTVGALREQKGHEFLIPAIPYLREEFPECRWIWVGDGEYGEKLDNLIREYNLEKFILRLGRRDDIKDLVNAADLFIFPTLYEGFPFALLEAMAAELPIIATDAGGIPEIIDHEINGLICRKADSCDLLETIRYALRNPEKMKIMAKNGKSKIKEFDQDSMTQKTIEFLSEMTK